MQEPWDMVDLVPDTSKQKYPNPVANYLIAFGFLFLGTAILVYLVHGQVVGIHPERSAGWTRGFLAGAGLVIIGLLIGVRTARRSLKRFYEP